MIGMILHDFSLHCFPAVPPENWQSNYSIRESRKFFSKADHIPRFLFERAGGNLLLNGMRGLKTGTFRGDILAGVGNLFRLIHLTLTGA